MIFQEIFTQKLRAFASQKINPTFLLAVSGGVDSMVLLWLFVNCFSRTANGEWHFQVAHINYKLRGEDSDLDQKLVEKFCEKYGVKYYIYEVSEQDDCPEKGSIQLWARELRYRVFKEIQEQKNIDFLVTAHHLNDQLETFIINLSRGSGLSGLRGIPADDNGIFRPLLEWSKAEIYAFAKAQNIPFREDISNQKTDYLRNKFRHKIVPELEKINADFLTQFHKSIHILGEANDFIKTQIDHILSALTLKKDEEYWVLNKSILAQKSDFEKFEILRRFGFENRGEIAKIFIAETGKSFHSKEFCLLINREELIFKSQKPEVRIQTLPILEQISDNEYSLKKNQLSTFNFQPQTWFFDKNKIKLPLKIRERQSGDVFFPKGMRGKKKVAKFLKDEKISQWDKDKTYILCDANEQILGVVPLRQDGRFILKNKREFIKVFFQ